MSVDLAERSYDVPFEKFKKIARYSREIVVTEKIDGTNGIIYIPPDSSFIKAGSRNQWLAPGRQDNLGFAAWVFQNREDLMSLGPGYHYGEWWGKGIQRRGYPVPDNDS